MVFPKPGIRQSVGDLAVRENRPVVEVVNVLQYFDQHAHRSILLLREGGVMISHQLDANGNIAQVRLPVPHADAGMVGPVFYIHDTIGPSVAGNHVVGVTSEGAPPIAKLFSLGDDSQRRLQSQLRCVDDDVFRAGPFDLFVSRIQMRAVIHDGALEFLPLGATEGIGNGRQRQKASKNQCPKNHQPFNDPNPSHMHDTISARETSVSMGNEILIPKQ